MNIENGAQNICRGIENALDKKTGLLVGRNGTIELDVVFHSIFSNIKPSSINLKILELNAGIFPSSQYETWVKAYIDAVKNANIMVAGWYAPLVEPEKMVFELLNKNVIKIPLRSLEAYYVNSNKRWTNLLEGHTVAVISAFAETAIKQINNREKIWGEDYKSLLPDSVKWVPIRTGYSPSLANGQAEWTLLDKDINNWKTAVNYVVDQVIDSGARFALIGCGGLGMCIGNELKKKGVICIVMGGAIQILFGIRGARWKNHNIISKFFNHYWTYPDISETPANAKMVENACYW